MDKTPLYSETVPSKCADKKGSKMGHVCNNGNENCHLMVLSSVSATGGDLSAIVIYKGQCPLKDTPHQPSMLITNSFHSHLTNKEMRNLTAAQAIIQDGCIQVLPPLDVSVNKSLMNVDDMDYLHHRCQKAGMHELVHKSFLVTI